MRLRRRRLLVKNRQVSCFLGLSVPVPPSKKPRRIFTRYTLRTGYAKYKINKVNKRFLI